MTANRKHGGADMPYRGLLNPPRPTGRYRLLDRNSDPHRSLPATQPEAPVNRPCDPHRTKGTS
jgi:hypothetical protein